MRKKCFFFLKPALSSQTGQEPDTVILKPIKTNNYLTCALGRFELRYMQMIVRIEIVFDV